MTFIIPNAPNATGTPFAVLDQSEPDSVDFESLGNTGRTFVVSGGQVSAVGSATSVAVTAASVVIDGTYYTVAASSALTLTVASDKRFDLIVARVSGASAVLAVISGTANATNPTYPLSRAVTTATFDGTIHFDSSTDVLLAAVYRPAGGIVTSAHIVDKRVLGKTLVSRQAAAAPTAGTATRGALYYNNTAAPTGSGSNLYVGGPDNNWTELAANSPASFVPIGGMIGWPSAASIPTGWLEASGQSVARTAYPALFSVYGVEHGSAASTHFNIPDYNGSGGFVPKGTTTSASGGSTSPGASIGVDSKIIQSAELPTHSHGVAHTHDYVHSHDLSSASTGQPSPATHTHPAVTANTLDSQVTSGGYFVRVTASGGSILPTVVVPTPFVTAASPTGTFNITATAANGSLSGTSTTLGFQVAKQYDEILQTTAAAHNHTVNTANATGDNNQGHVHTSPTLVSQTVSTTLASGQLQSNATSGTSSVTNTAGSSTSMSIVQASKYVRWIIRAL